MSLHEIKRNDTRPYWPVTLTYSDGSPVVLTGATVRFIARGDSGVVKIDTAAVVTAAADGEVEWRPTAGQTDEAGAFLCEWEVTFDDGTVQTFPTTEYDRLRVIGDLA